MMHFDHSGLVATARWDRATVATSRDDVTLAISISGHAPMIQRDPAPAEIVFVLDRSGSMSGEKLTLVKEATIQAIAALDRHHRAAVVAFDDQVTLVQPLTAMTPEGKREMQDRVRTIEVGGSTNLSSGWLTGCDELARLMTSQAVARRVVLLTDGQANAGITNHGDLAHHASELRRRGIVTSTMGVGRGFNEVLLSVMAEAGGGNFRYLDRAETFASAFRNEVEGLLDLVAIRPELDLTLPPGYRAKLLNMFPTQRAGKTITVALRDISERDELNLAFAVTHIGRIGPSSVVRARLTWIPVDDGGRESIAIPIEPLVVVPDRDAANAPVDHAVRLLRAREESSLEQRDALRLDREGRFAESRMVFAQSHQRLATADAQAARTGYAGVSAESINEIRIEIDRTDTLARTAPAPLDEHTHKERAANRAARSRGDRRD